MNTILVSCIFHRLRISLPRSGPLAGYEIRRLHPSLVTPARVWSCFSRGDVATVRNVVVVAAFLNLIIFDERKALQITHTQTHTWPRTLATGGFWGGWSMVPVCVRTSACAFVRECIPI